MKNIYLANGFKNRAFYLAHLADEFDLDLDIVLELADTLGENEDFDGLVSFLQDV